MNTKVLAAAVLLGACSPSWAVEAGGTGGASAAGQPAAEGAPAPEQLLIDDNMRAELIERGLINEDDRLETRMRIGAGRRAWDVVVVGRAGERDSDTDGDRERASSRVIGTYYGSDEEGWSFYDPSQSQGQGAFGFLRPLVQLGQAVSGPLQQLNQGALQAAQGFYGGGGGGMQMRIEVAPTTQGATAQAAQLATDPAAIAGLGTPGGAAIQAAAVVGRAVGAAAGAATDAARRLTPQGR